MHQARGRRRHLRQPDVCTGRGQGFADGRHPVNGTALNEQLVDTFLQAVTGKPAAEAPKEQRDALVEQLINMTLAAQAAEKDGLAKDGEVQARLELLRTQILAEAASEKYVKSHPGVGRRSEGGV